MILLDLKDSRPIYEQVAERLQELMMLGVLEEDSQMPSVRGLAMELSINPNTIQRAYGELERIWLTRLKMREDRQRRKKRIPTHQRSGMNKGGMAV